MKRIFAAVFAFALVSALGAYASAQSPDDTGAGDRLGMQQLNNSGQIGAVTLFNHGATTNLVVALDSVPPGRVEAVTIHRGRDCDSVDPKALMRLTDLKNGRSRSTVKMSQDKLLSGNYSVLVYSGTQSNAHAVACGHLYR
ncbi:MAG: hypothetical protein ABR591_04845 [Candidatus Velthaea sp.]